MRVGNVVTVSGEVLIDAAAAGEARFYVTLPVASDLSGSCQLAGTAATEYGYVPGGNGVTPARVYGDAANDRALVEFYNPGNLTYRMSLHFTYLVS
jgi:hypothetical protein